MDMVYIEDNKIERMKLRLAFEHLGISSERLRIVNSANKGFEILRSDSFEPKLILIDLNMPCISGLEFLEKVKLYSSISHIPIIILCTSKHSQEVKQCYQKGASAYLVKPADYKTSELHK